MSGTEDDSETASGAAFPFLRLPLELREQVYSHYFHPGDHLVQNADLEARGFYGGVYRWDLSVLHVCKQVYAESKKVWRRENVFVKVATPWPSAVLVNHISSEGLVPIVCTDAKADAFADHHAVVQITAPFHGVVPEHTVVMLVDDLHLFTKTWYYSALSYPMLNERLSTTFILRNPAKTGTEFSHDDDDDVAAATAPGQKEGLGVPIALQKKLLLPFEHVKGLHGIRIYGYSSSVKAELARLQALPVPSLQESLESATDLMAAGDAALATHTPSKEDAAQRALDLYKQAFHAIHILIHGRSRRVLADVFFHDTIPSGRYAGQTGLTVRVILRLKLVARTIAAYNQLAQWHESAFWGMRSAHILDDNFNPDFEAFLTNVLGAADVALIYLRTAIAFWHMETHKEDWLGELIAYADEEMADSIKLWAKARAFLFRISKNEVRAELKAYGVPQDVMEVFTDA
ncbi:uncharacterized protein SETTUDRAFT_162810 [Exserohilum turcica Et28A]|uniref:Uncharacterized protein n=1 Tax=Exserohilum turcicum (strain 28A) TaxID=671987 RepID=R0IPA7_EXST2|nr:uncharacterized protein SETTUDRAFT_162810 [Exserohilum turcica Et28A]EOA86571.1 hypothetical protein SETTUDRAFT_162810 [Exserohilum turcica Et28A]